MLGQRVLTALLLVAILLPPIFVLPAWTWAAVALVFLALATREWVALLPAAGGQQGGWRGAVAAALIGLALLAWRLTLGWPAWFGAAVGLAATGWWCLAAPMRLGRHDSRGGGAVLAVALLLACWVALVELHARGPAALFAALAIVWIADIAAYFVGRTLGRRKLAPAISPGKSWEGALGGALAVALAGAGAARLAHGSGPAAPWLAQTLPAQLFASLPAALAALVLVALAALSVLGDLHESLLKRQAGAKDSGTLLPGHGGVLDRVDALVPVMPAVLLLHRLVA